MMQTQISPDMLAGLHGARADRDGASTDIESVDEFINSIKESSAYLAQIKMEE